MVLASMLLYIHNIREWVRQNVTYFMKHKYVCYDELFYKIWLLKSDKDLQTFWRSLADENVKYA
jgi:hypothetical protein